MPGPSGTLMAQVPCGRVFARRNTGICVELAAIGEATLGPSNQWQSTGNQPFTKLTYLIKIKAQPASLVTHSCTLAKTHINIWVKSEQLSRRSRSDSREPGFDARVVPLMPILSESIERPAVYHALMVKADITRQDSPICLACSSNMKDAYTDILLRFEL
ncbi:hypothetical protein PGT21_001499 [Puccinia graminis f. sp. tritici]|uniref:Uncharacterized protein n=1 Tax=Puccinia graminis f. sp. tritici TaxID=56615 RepID=A0A5B0Q1T3_PUCGR|nr:hypothetical protein PGT21_001499 [Puccinia graminis f. sp. tritici]